MDITNYGFYTLQCKLRDNGGKERFPYPSAGYMHVPHARRDPVGITQWTLESPPVFENHHFHWMFIQASEPEHYYIVNRRSGLCLRVPNKEGVQQLEQDYYSPERDVEFRFVLEPTTHSASSYRLVSFSNGNLLLIDGAKPDNGQHILSYPDVPPADMTNLGHAEFELTSVEDAKISAPGYAEENAEPGEFRQLPQPATLDQRLPSSFPDLDVAHAVEHQIVPFFMVKDPDLAPYRQVELAPYYTLRQYQRWDKVLDRQFDGLVERETTETVVVGMTQLDAYTFKSTFRMSTEATAQMGYQAGGFSGSLNLATKIAKEVEDTRERSTERNESRTRTEDVKYPDLRFPYRMVTWVPTDVYRLCRMNGLRAVGTWTVKREGEDVTYLLSGAAIQLPE